MRASRKSLFKRFGIPALGESHFPKGLAFPRLAKVVSRMVWHFRARRKSFPEWFGISAPGESRFPNGLAFPRLAKVVSRVVWHFRARRKSFSERFGISALGENHFPKGLAFPRSAKYPSQKKTKHRNKYHMYLPHFKVNPESYLSNFRGFYLFLGGCNLFNKSKKTLCVRNVQRGEYVL